jgi:hypothetical protein
MWRVARPFLSDSAPVVTGLRAEGMGTGFFVGRIRLTSHHRRPERNPMPTCSRLSMTANRTCRLGMSASRRKRAEMCWPMYGPSPSDAMGLESLSAGIAGRKKGVGMTPLLIPCSGSRGGEGSSQVPFLLIERARSEGARSTRAFDDRSDNPPRERYDKLGGSIVVVVRRARQGNR